MIEIVERDIIDWAKEYSGEKFHAMLCDPPYHLTSIVERFGKNGSAPAKDKDGVYKRSSKGFMGKDWDGGDIAFVPETWVVLGEHLLPGALGMAFASSRGWHRMAVAIEDAGMIIHPSIFGWAQGSGFPKASNPEKVLRKRGDERAGEFEGYRYGAQAIKPAIEPIIVFQKPFGNVQIDNILRYGTGLYDIDRNRIGANNRPLREVAELNDSVEYGGTSFEGRLDGSLKTSKAVGETNQGRWPANFYLQHEPGCQMIGYRDENYQINRFVDGAKPWGDAVGEEFDSEEIENRVPVWECVGGCPIGLLDLQSGELTSGAMKKPYDYTNTGPVYGEPAGQTRSIHDKSSGGASRFFFQSHWELEQQDPVIYCAKAGKKEKDAGLENRSEREVAYAKYRENFKDTKDFVTHYPDGSPRPVNKLRNDHPTVKPLALCKHLAGLLLPPAAYSPRRILVPFAGTGSEMIGAYQAGWDVIVGIEKEHEYIEIASQRIDHWTKQPKQLAKYHAIYWTISINSV
jgi:hypothetical protein